MNLRAEGVSRRFFRTTRLSNVFLAVKDASLTLEPGKLTAITGRSGSGKSTLLNMMAGLLAPTAGTIRLDDTDLYALDDRERSRLRNRSFGIIPQGQTGLNSLTVLENVKLPFLLYGEEAPTEWALALLEELGIGPLQGAYPNELSGGELRRLSIARALIREPGIILADEPTGDLDDENTKTVLTLLRRAADRGAAVLLVTHEEDALSYADLVYHMNDGVLREERSHCT